MANIVFSQDFKLEASKKLEKLIVNSLGNSMSDITQTNIDILNIIESINISVSIKTIETQSKDRDYQVHIRSAN
jgi:hypothetical protein